MCLRIPCLSSFLVSLWLFFWEWHYYQQPPELCFVQWSGNFAALMNLKGQVCWSNQISQFSLSAQTWCYVSWQGIFDTGLQRRSGYVALGCKGGMCFAVAFHSVVWSLLTWQCCGLASPCWPHELACRSVDLTQTEYFYSYKDRLKWSRV